MVRRSWAVAVALVAACSGGKGTDTSDTDTDTGEPGPAPLAVLADSDVLHGAILSIWGTSDQDMFLVGSDDGSGPLLLHWDGAAWTRLDTGTTGDLWWIWSDGGDQVWLSGEGGRVVTYTRSTGAFTEQIVADPVYSLFGIWGASPTDIWAVGGDVNGSNDGIAVHFDGTAWSTVGTAPVNPADGTSKRQMFKVWGASSTDVWFVGTGALLEHWDGTALTDLPQPVYSSVPLVTVDGSSASEVFVVGGYGNGSALHGDGATWTDVSPPPQDLVPGLNGVRAGNGTAVACGVRGALLQWDGAAWAADPRAPVVTGDYHACWIDDQGAVWAVGGELTTQTAGLVVYSGDAVDAIAL